MPFIHPLCGTTKKRRRQRHKHQRKRGLLSAHSNEGKPAKCFHVVEYDGIPGLKYWKPEAKHTQTPKKQFSAFPFPLFHSQSCVHCLSSCWGIMCAGMRWKDDSRRRGEAAVMPNRKSIIPHCLIVFVLISLPFINHYRSAAALWGGRAGG